MVEKNMVTLTERTVMKSRSGVYSDTSENRRKHRVGQKYGVEKQSEDSEKTEKKETDPAKELEAVNKVIAAINEGKLNLPAAEVIKLSEKKQKLEATKKQAEKINAGAKANEEKKNTEEAKETNKKINEAQKKEPEILQWGGEKNPDFRKGTKEQFQNLYKKIEGKTVDLGHYGKGMVIGMQVRDDGYTEAIVQTRRGSLLEAPYSEALEGKVENMFGGSSLKRGLVIDPKALSSEKEEKSKTEEKKEVTDLRDTEKWLQQEIGDITKKIEGIANKTIQISPREKSKVFQRLEKLKSSLKDTQEKLKASGENVDGGAKPVDPKKDIQEQGSEAKKESYTRVKFEDVPNSGKVNLKKYLSEKMKRSADETWGDISKIDTKGLQKMEKGLVEDFNRQFDDLPKSRRAEKLYAIIKVKGELAKRGKESQTTETGKDSDKSEDKVGGVGVKDIFNDIRLLNPSQSTISSLGTFVSSQNQQIADSERQRVMKYLPKDSLAYKIAFDADKFTDKQLWVIAYELNKNKNFKEDLAGRLEEYRRQEEFERARKRAKREAKRNRGI